MNNYAPTCDNKYRNCLKCLNCIVNYNQVKKQFKNIRLQYVCDIQHNDKYKTPTTHTNIKMSISNWNMYRYFNIPILNNYSDKIEFEKLRSLCDDGKYLFVDAEINRRLQAECDRYTNELFISYFVNNSIIPHEDYDDKHLRLETNTLSEAVYYFLKASFETVQIDSMITKFIQDECKFINQKSFFGMIQFYNEHKHVSIFTKKQQTIFYECMNLKKKLLDEYSNANETPDYFKWKTNEKLSYKIVASFKNCFTWSKIDNNTINIQFLDSLVECYVKDKITSLPSNCSRGLCFNYLLLPHCADSYKCLKTLFKYKQAVPIFRSKCVSIHEFIAFLKPHSVDIFQRMKNNTISNILKCVCSEQKRLVQFMNENIDSSKPKKTKKKKSKCKNNSLPSQVIDISDASNNTIIEIDITPNIPEIISQTNENESDSDSDSDSDENINQSIDTIIEPTALVKYTNYPYVITFYRYEYIPLHEQDKITFMINECYTTDEYFRDFIKQYTTIRVVQSFHYDYSQKYNSLHFNTIFLSNSIKSPVYHCYIQNNRICSMTTIINILQRK